MGDGAPMKGEVRGEVEFKSGPDQFFKLWKSEPHRAPYHAPSLHEVQIHEGDWDTPGSIKIGNCTIGGKNEVFKEMIEVDEEKKMVKLIGVDGEVFKIYKMFATTCHITPKGEGYIAKIRTEYEKINPNVPAPNNYLDLVINFTKDIDASLIHA